MWTTHFFSSNVCLRCLVIVGCIGAAHDGPTDVVVDVSAPSTVSLPATVAADMSNPLGVTYALVDAATTQTSEHVPVQFRLEPVRVLGRSLHCFRARFNASTDGSGDATAAREGAGLAMFVADTAADGAVTERLAVRRHRGYRPSTYVAVLSIVYVFLPTPAWAVPRSE
jgi:hypothetical protein